MKWRDAKERAWLVARDWRREVHLALEPIECKIARRFAFRKNPASRYTRSELVEALMHDADGLLHRCVVASFRCAVERLRAGREPIRALVDLLARQRLDLDAFFRSERRKCHQ